jgi:hypothetical protein
MMKPKNMKPKYEAPTALCFGELNITSGEQCDPVGNGASQAGDCMASGNGASSGTCESQGNGAHINTCIANGNGYSNPGSVG